MEKRKLKKLIETATGRVPADLCIKNAKVIDVFDRSVFNADIYISDYTIRLHSLPTHSAY